MLHREVLIFLMLIWSFRLNHQRMLRLIFIDLDVLRELVKPELVSHSGRWNISFSFNKLSIRLVFLSQKLVSHNLKMSLKQPQETLSRSSRLLTRIFFTFSMTLPTNSLPCQTVILKQLLKRHLHSCLDAVRKSFPLDLCWMARRTASLSKLWWINNLMV